MADKIEEKMFGQKIPIKLYWDFKTVATQRKEKLVDSFKQALQDYVDKNKKEEV